LTGAAPAEKERAMKPPAMKPTMQYGRRIVVPSMVQVRHELRAFIAEWNVRELCAEADGLPITASWKELEAHRLARGAAGTPVA
jgi:hypothetical protein